MNYKTCTRIVLHGIAFVPCGHRAKWWFRKSPKGEWQPACGKHAQITKSGMERKLLPETP